LHWVYIVRKFLLCTTCVIGLSSEQPDYVKEPHCHDTIIFGLVVRPMLKIDLNREGELIVASILKVRGCLVWARRAPRTSESTSFPTLRVQMAERRDP
jgi:hypothetical protein